MNCIQRSVKYCDSMYYEKHQCNMMLFKSSDINTGNVFILKRPCEGNYRFNKVEQIGNLIAAPAQMLSNNEKSITSGRCGCLKNALAIVALFTVLLPFIVIGGALQVIGRFCNSNGEKLLSATAAKNHLDYVLKSLQTELKELDTENRTENANIIHKEYENRIEKLVDTFNENIQSMVLLEPTQVAVLRWLVSFKP